ncbi:hypothetical protein A0H81_04105 [Grifola frondosa]|uniref:Uncharacterized protein n=1 Tax=Grifola frondosa TaxID=5627 RepID=A0A1C7MFZ8_GRIFR|nr:hypothetical protein A0H81_04105 [Grifola frondosa]
MRFTSCLSFLLLTVPVTVSACEGECIVGITNAFLGNYTSPIQAVMMNIAQQISDILDNHPESTSTLRYLDPILEAYNAQSYSEMETAIFPGYFHGKCQQDGVDPPGCPNPDCPVVCGTPGSLVHFYPKLRYIAFNNTRYLMKSLCTPGTDSYKKVEAAVLDAADAKPPSRRMSRVFPRAMPESVAYRTSTAYASSSTLGYGFDSTADDNYGDVSDSEPSSDPMALVPLFLAKRAADVKTKLKNILETMGELLEKVCGGSGTEAPMDCRTVAGKRT